MHDPREHAQERPSVRSFRSRGIDVQISESKDHVELTLDGVPIKVSVVDGKYHSQLANQFVGFSSIEDVVEMLLSHQGKTWTLHGHVCDESCGPDCHHHEGHPHTHAPGEGGGHTHGGSGGHTHEGSGGHTHAPGGGGAHTHAPGGSGAHTHEAGGSGAHTHAEPGGGGHTHPAEHQHAPGEECDCDDPGHEHAAGEGTAPAGGHTHGDAGTSTAHDHSGVKQDTNGADPGHAPDGGGAR
jgi:hypothetical protein